MLSSHGEQLVDLSALLGHAEVGGHDLVTLADLPLERRLEGVGHAVRRREVPPETAMPSSGWVMLIIVTVSESGALVSGSEAGEPSTWSVRCAVEQELHAAHVPGPRPARCRRPAGPPALRPSWTCPRAGRAGRLR